MLADILNAKHQRDVAYQRCTVWKLSCSLMARESSPQLHQGKQNNHAPSPLVWSNCWPRLSVTSRFLDFRTIGGRAGELGARAGENRGKNITLLSPSTETAALAIMARKEVSDRPPSAEPPLREFLELSSAKGSVRCRMGRLATCLEVRGRMRRGASSSVDSPSVPPRFLFAYRRFSVYG